MTYSECLDIRNKNLSMIGKIIERDKMNYEIENIVIYPPLQYNQFLLDYRNSGGRFDSAISRFIKNDDLDVFLYTTNLSTGNIALLKL